VPLFFDAQDVCGANERATKAANDRIKRIMRMEPFWLGDEENQSVSFV